MPPQKQRIDTERAKRLAYEWILYAQSKGYTSNESIVATAILNEFHKDLLETIGAHLEIEVEPRGKE